MPERFVAVALHRTERQAAAAVARSLVEALDLPIVFQSARLVIAAEGPVIAVDGGAVIGRVFARNDYRPASAIAGTRAMLGSVLLEQYWGDYIAVVDDGGPEGPMAMRDPTGARAAFFHNHPGRTTIASDVRTLARAVGRPFPIDWAWLTLSLQKVFADGDRTALSGVRELRPGHQARLAPVTTTHAVWSPWTFARATSTIADRDLPEALGQTIRGCVQAWASRFDRISLGVSGGLDSSVIAASLPDGQARLVCYTLATLDAEGDERAEAGLLTRALGLPLRECAWDPTDIDIRAASAPHVPRPVANYAAQALTREKDRLERNLGVTAHFSGAGGDNIFCYLTSAAPVSDRLRVEGMGLGVLTSARELSAITSASLSEIARGALAHLGPRRQYRPPLETNRFVRVDQTLYAAERFAHPWLNAPADILPGKTRHVAMLALAETGVGGDPAGSRAPSVTPLISQPITELCLSIPSWKWMRGGRNRALVREAFAGRLPPAILNRTTKGGPASLPIELLERNRQLLTDFLLGGRLAEQRVFDADAVETTLASDRPLSRRDYRELLGLASAEAWTRAWS